MALWSPSSNQRMEDGQVHVNAAMVHLKSLR